MPALESGLVFLPRFTTLFGAAEFTTAPLDVSGQAGTQFQAWRGPFRSSGGSPAFTLYLEESLDASSWALGPSTPQGFPIAENAVVFFAYAFRLRWFRLRVEVSGTDPMVSCWAEGILRAGDGGMWGPPAPSPLAAAGAFADSPFGPAVVDSGRPPEDPWAEYRAAAAIPFMPGQDINRTYDRLRAAYRAAAAKPGALLDPPPFPTPAWMPSTGVPVSPPQLQVQTGP